MEEHEFDCFILPNYWYHCLNLHGEGNAVYFPIRVRPFLSKLSAKNFVANNKGSLLKLLYYTWKNCAFIL